MKNRIRIVIAAALLASALPAAAGEIVPNLAAHLQGLADDDVVKVLVVLRDQADVPAIDRELHAAKAGRAHRHRTVLAALQDKAKATQPALVADLAGKSGRGVRGYRAHWLVNAVVVTADVATIRELAARDDVARIEPDLRVELIEPVDAAVQDKAAPPTRAVPDGVGAIRAHEVWYSLGIDGTGVIVANLDTGVDATHPALAASWRGNTVPASQAWFVPGTFGNPAFPSDEHGHGTHTMGTMLGVTATDTVGIAPGATWIASNAIYNYTDVFDSGILAALEFFADPDGNPATTDDVPAVVNNSWGMVTHPDSTYVPCDSRWWDAIDNCEAAGIVMVWGAGNEGPGASSLRMPADRATTATNCFAVGSVTNLAPFYASSFSSRGPSLCGGPYAIKPEVSAPGSHILSTWPGGAYAFLSGTSMATPHVAGTIALMRQANPDADVTTIKQTLMDTARDIGAAGEDNESGWGVIDAYAAVLAIMPHTGTVSGVITDGGTGQPLAGALVARVGGLETAVTGADGAFSFLLPSGSRQFTVRKFGYDDGLIDVAIVDDATVSGDLILDPQPLATVSGTVTDPDGAPVAGAVVTVRGTPLAPVASDGSGFYAVDVPSGPTAVYVFRAIADGLGYLDQEVPVTGALTLDFGLPIDTTEDFESNDLLAYPWHQTGNPFLLPWYTTPGGVEGGSYCVRSIGTPTGITSGIGLDYDVAEPGDLSFWLRTSSEEYYDYLNFYVDDVLVARWSGETPWQEFRHPLTAGPHALSWEYAKDQGVNAGEDAVWLDFITFPVPVIPPTPTVGLNVTSVETAVPPDGTGSAPVSVFNTGGAGLEFKARVQAIDGAKAAGLDPFGYTWSDSDEPGGPDYAWREISGDGAEAGVADDALLGPFALGFSMPFYQATYDSVWIGTNGFLSFTNDTADYRNTRIPDAAAPNGMLAFFWDDLRSNMGGTIYYKAEPDSGRFIVQFQDVIRYYTATPHTMQVILHADGDIVYQYADVTEPESATVGIENAGGTVGVNVAYNDAGYLHAGLAIRFTYPEPVAWATVAPDSGVVAAGGNLPLAVMFDAAGLPEGVHQAQLVIQSNDPVRPLYAVPVNLTVSSLSGVDDAALPRRVVLHAAVPNPFNPATDLRFGLPQAAPVSLRIYDVAGRQVRELVHGRLPAGEHAVRWDGRDDSGRAAASGVFFARLVVADEVKTQRMTLLR